MAISNLQTMLQALGMMNQLTGVNPMGNGLTSVNKNRSMKPKSALSNQPFLPPNPMGFSPRNDGMKSPFLRLSGIQHPRTRTYNFMQTYGGLQ